MTKATDESGSVAPSVSLGPSHLASRCGSPPFSYWGWEEVKALAGFRLAWVGEGRWSTLAKRPLARLPAQESASRLGNHGKVAQS